MSRNTKRSQAKSSAPAEDEARVDELLANPDRQPAEDKELDQLLHRQDNPVVTGNVSVDPVSNNGTGLTTRATLRGENGGDNVTREVDSADSSESDKAPEPDATETGASRAGATEADKKKSGFFRR